MSFRIRLARSRPMRLLGSIAMKCWAFSGVYILICFLLYWLYGGILAFFLLCFATTGLYLFLLQKVLFSDKTLYYIYHYFIISYRNIFNSWIILYYDYFYISNIFLLLQEYSITGKINFFIIQNCHLIPEFMCQLLQYLIYHIKVCILELEMVQCYTCSLFPNQRIEWGRHLRYCFCMAMLAIWATGIQYLLFYFNLLFYYIILLFYLYYTYSHVKNWS